MLSKKLFLIALLPFFSCSNSTYDTSTPEKFVVSMGLISQQPKSENPLPFFYEEESAVAIGNFDKMGEKGLVAFDMFRNLVAEKFPNNIKTNQKGKLKVTLDAFAGLKIKNFTYSATMIGAQLKERKPSDYEFVSATSPDENGISQLTVKILGKEKTLPIKKTKEGYRMFLPKNILKNISNSVKKIEQLVTVFTKANKLLENGTITEENFEVKMGDISIEYEKSLK